MPRKVNNNDNSITGHCLLREIKGMQFVFSKIKMHADNSLSWEEEYSWKTVKKTM